MSIGHWWFSLLLDAGEYRRVEPGFAEAMQTDPYDDGERAIAAWRAEPAAFEAQAITRQGKVHELSDPFVQAFNLSGFDRFSRELVHRDGSLSDLMSEDRVFRFIISNRHPPVSILWHALGPERAGELPGIMGNLLVAPGQLPSASEAVARAYEGTREPDLIARGLRFCAGSGTEDAVRETVTHLPDLLARADAEGKGILLLGRPQL